MIPNNQKILVTGATGQLGQLVVAGLLEKQPAESIVVIARNAAALDQFTALGVEGRVADYSQPETLQDAFDGIDRLLLISSNAVGQREAHHRNAVVAAKAAGVRLIVYTSILRADSSELELASEHVATEQFIVASGVPYVFLRNGWYLENYSSAVQQALASGSFAGASAQGRISAAPRADYAAAAVAVLTATDVKSGTVYELAGDTSFTMDDFATSLAALRGSAVEFHNLAEAEYDDLLKSFGLPAAAAHIYSQSDAAASRGALFDDGRELSRLIGRPTMTVEQWLATMQIMATS